ncbi:MAG: tryptophan-rich sensory protein [Planctomycetaceae bacterium]|nr:tryptophan-rich sensory protein [Planctomycetaceae bacterium]
MRPLAYNILILAAFLLLCFGVMGLGGWITAPAVRDWYATLRKPPWNPPAWVFAPVWTFLFGTMAVSAWLVWLRRDSTAITAAMVLFGVQLALNLAWSALFFGLHRPLWALADIAGLLAAIIATIALFWRVHPLAGQLLIPYAAWVTYASTLNAAVWWLNRAA